MIGLDTNIVVRYLVQDDPIQSRRATEIIEGCLTARNPGFISVVAVAEMVWVLDRAYGLSDEEIVAAIERVLQADVLVVENEQGVFAAMTALKEGLGSFADALIGALGAKAAPPLSPLIDGRCGFPTSSSRSFARAQPSSGTGP